MKQETPRITFPEPNTDLYWWAVTGKREGMIVILFYATGSTEEEARDAAEDYMSLTAEEGREILHQYPEEPEIVSQPRLGEFDAEKAWAWTRRQKYEKAESYIRTYDEWQAGNQAIVRIKPAFWEAAKICSPHIPNSCGFRYPGHFLAQAPGYGVYVVLDEYWILQRVSFEQANAVMEQLPDKEPDDMSQFALRHFRAFECETPYSTRGLDYDAAQEDPEALYAAYTAFVAREYPRLRPLSCSQFRETLLHMSIIDVIFPFPFPPRLVKDYDGKHWEGIRLLTQGEKDARAADYDMFPPGGYTPSATSAACPVLFSRQGKRVSGEAARDAQRFKAMKMEHPEYTYANLAYAANKRYDEKYTKERVEYIWRKVMGWDWYERHDE